MHSPCFKKGRGFGQTVLTTILFHTQTHRDSPGESTMADSEKEKLCNSYFATQKQPQVSSWSFLGHGGKGRRAAEQREREAQRALKQIQVSRRQMDYILSH